VKRTIAALGGIAALTSLLTGCGAINAAKDVKDAAKGIANAEKDAKDFEAKYEKSKTLTFSATYTVKKPGAPDETITVTQKPPKSLYKQGDTLLVDDGIKLYNCTKSDGKEQCIEIGPHTESGLFGAGVGLGGGFGFAFNPAQFTGLYLAAAIVPGVNASKSQREVAGLQSDCTRLEFTQGEDKGKRLDGCTSTDGVFTYSYATDGTEVTLTKYDTSVSDSAFTLPAKAQSTDDLIRDSTSTTESSSTSSTTSTTEASTTSSSETATTYGP
jgi:hypothetical protein